MIEIYVYGTPPKINPEPLIDKIITTVKSIKALKLGFEEIAVFFPPDRVKKDLGQEVIVKVESLPPRPKRTKAAQTFLAYQLGTVVMNFYKANRSPTKVVQVRIIPFDQTTGYAHFHR